jgi:hypothetical protein
MGNGKNGAAWRLVCSVMQEQVKPGQPQILRFAQDDKLLESGFWVCCSASL